MEPLKYLGSWLLDSLLGRIVITKFKGPNEQFNRMCVSNISSILCINKLVGSDGLGLEGLVSTHIRSVTPSAVIECNILLEAKQK